MKKIIVEGARENNLKNIDVEIPRDSLTVVTGVSGSGKSSLAFNTIYAEGQRRYIETFSAYARNFLGNVERPDVDSIRGLSPVISIEQKTTNRNPRSTVGTTTEVYDFLRLLYARAATAYSYLTGEKMIKYTEDKIIDLIIHEYAERRILILSPLVKGRKGHYRDLFENLLKRGYLYARVDQKIVEIADGMRLDRYKTHSIEVVVDKLMAREKDRERLRNTIANAMKLGDGIVLIVDNDSGRSKYYSKHLMCPTTGMSYKEPAPPTFSFNSPQGACPRCKGLGVVTELDLSKIIPDRSISIAKGGIAPLGKSKNSLIFYQIATLLEHHGYSIDTPIEQLSEEALNEVLFGSLEKVKVKAELLHSSSDYFSDYSGIIKYLHATLEEDDSKEAQRWAEQFRQTCVCPECHGMRLNKEALSYRILDKNIAELAEMDISELRQWLDDLPRQLDTKEKTVAEEILKEISKRVSFLEAVGLDYLSLNRPSAQLSGGESQRIRLATQIGSQLVNVLYILDEPSIGLHQRDNDKLIASLKELRDIGNTVVVVEHDRDMMLNADYLIDIGPGAGQKGGQVCFAGVPTEKVLQTQQPTTQNPKTTTKNQKPTTHNQQPTASLTLDYLNGTRTIDMPKSRREGNGKKLVLHGCRGNNLKNVDVEFPLGKLILVTGVSGSGKSTLVNETLYPILSQKFYRSLKRPLDYDSIDGMENIDKVIAVDQSPIGRTPRSNAATYTNVFADIRNLFVATPAAKMRGYKAGRFSFNVRGGRCEACCGNGYKTIEMNFLPDVTVPCEVCHGKRYSRETLEVRYKGKSIADVLDMTIDQAVDFFENVPNILQKIQTLKEVGLGYIKLGQPATTLSGGESQRVKLATELCKRDTGKTLYILDEPTTGLHFEDIRMLMEVLNKLVDKGNTVVVIEHNMDVIKLADHIIDMGPEGGRKGGQLLFTGTPEEMVKKAQKKSYTALFLAKEMRS